MAERPSFQFYPGDWIRNSNLRRCSLAARGAWIEVMCLLHDSDEYGVLRWPLSEIAKAAKVRIKYLHELVDKGVLKGSDSAVNRFVFAPKHAGKVGVSVTLIEENCGPCWYSSRFVKDEYIRTVRGKSSQFTAENQPPKATPKATPKGGIGERQGDGSSSASAIAENNIPVAEAISKPAAAVFDSFDDDPEAPPDQFKKFHMHIGWKPHEALLADCCRVQGFDVNKITPEVIGEFSTFYSGVRGEMTHAQWVNRLIKGTKRMIAMNHPAVTAAPGGFIERITDRSWAEGL